MKILYLAKTESGSVGVFLAHENEIQGVLDAHAPAHIFVSYREVGPDDMPSNRDFRNAWCDVTEEPGVDVDMQKAKTIALDHVRNRRKTMLEELDKQTVIALGRGDEKERIAVEAKKDVLRDVTEPLKAIEVTGYNDHKILAELKRLKDLALPE